MTQGAEGQSDEPVESVKAVRAALRHLMQADPRMRPLGRAAAPLERIASGAEPPRVDDAHPVEDATLRARAVPGVPTPGFAAFLDGTQESELLAWRDAAPIVMGHVGAVVRVRAERRLSTWRQPRLERAIYAPWSLTPKAPWRQALPNMPLRDTGFDADDLPARSHPTTLLERALRSVMQAREKLERELARDWCAAESRPLLVDGSISAEVVATSPLAVGLIKSHRTLYVDAGGLAVVLALRAGERSSVLRIAPRERPSVLSWYLRLREPSGDPLWGLVRVEVADHDAAPEARADAVSRWILAERRPLSLPDPRWDTMVYPVRNCEELLRGLRARVTR